jgi:hypothetical protein
MFDALDEGYTVEFRGVTYITKHGGPFDRGTADSWYSRPAVPHKGGVGGDSGERTTDLTDTERSAYYAGYEYNELHGGKKDYS